MDNRIINDIYLVSYESYILVGSSVATIHKYRLDWGQADEVIYWHLFTIGHKTHFRFQG